MITITREDLATARSLVEARFCVLVHSAIAAIAGTVLIALAWYGLFAIAALAIVLSVIALLKLPSRLGSKIASFDQKIAKRTGGLDQDAVAYRFERHPSDAADQFGDLMTWIHKTNARISREPSPLIGNMIGVISIMLAFAIGYGHVAYRSHESWTIYADSTSLVPVYAQVVERIGQQMEVTSSDDIPVPVGPDISTPAESGVSHETSPNDILTADRAQQFVLNNTNTVPVVVDLVGKTIPNVRRTIRMAQRLAESASTSNGDFTKLDHELEDLRNEVSGLMNDELLPEKIQRKATEVRAALDSAQNAIKQISNADMDKMKAEFERVLKEQLQDLVNQLLSELMKQLTEWLNDALSFLDQMFGGNSGFSKFVKDIAKQGINNAMAGKSGGEILSDLGNRMKEELGSVTVTVNCDGDFDIRLEPSPTGTQTTDPGTPQPFDPGKGGIIRDGETGKSRSTIRLNSRGDSISPYAPSHGG